MHDLLLLDDAFDGSDGIDLAAFIRQMQLNEEARDRDSMRP
jgi:hypothetical protein